MSFSSLPIPTAPFTSFAFAATGAPTLRTLPDRLAEVKNVKDFGAVGDGSTDDTAAIQAAVNWSAGANRGVIFFPQGTYQITSPITFHLSAGITSIAFVGSPGAKLRGNFADALLKRSPDSPVGGTYLIETLVLENNHAAGKCIMFHSIVGGKVVCCQLSGFIGIETYNSQSVTIDSCSIISGGLGGASIGVVAGNATTLIATDVSGFANGLRHCNAGLTVIGGRFEVNTVAFELSVDPAGVGSQSVGVFVTGVSMESNGTGIRIGNGSGGGSTMSFEAISISCAQPSKANGIYIVSSVDNISFKSITISNADAGGWSGAGVNIQGGGNIVMDVVTSTASAGAIWSVVGSADVEFRQCNAPMPALANLPSASGAAKNARRYISDANTATPTFGATAVGGGSNRAPVWTDGTNWRYG